MKTCSNCGEKKPLDSFYNAKRSQDGKGTRCKVCVRIYRTPEHKQRMREAKEDAKRLRESGMRRCGDCGEPKPIESFHSDKARRSGRHPYCPDCVSNRARVWREKNQDYLKESKRLYREANLERHRDRDREYYKANQERLCEYQRQYRLSDPDGYKEQRRRYRERHAERIRERKRRYHSLNRERLNAKARKYQKENLHRRREYWHTYKQRPDVRLGKAMRSILSEFFRKAKQSKSGSSHELLGYTPDQLRQRMECQFKPGMTWENHGDWHIDHKIPVSIFLKRGEVRPHIVNALSNLQPLWAQDNMSKKDKHPLECHKTGVYAIAENNTRERFA